MPFTAFGVSDGLACSIKATVPATTGAAMLVPLSVRYARSLPPAKPLTSSCVFVA